MKVELSLDDSEEEPEGEGLVTCCDDQKALGSAVRFSTLVNIAISCIGFLTLW